jgi:virulence-associated protein VagC
MKRAHHPEAYAPLPARITVRVPLTIHRRGGRKRIITPVGMQQPFAKPARVENAAVKALAKAFRWRSMIESGQYNSIRDLAKAEKVNESYACRLLRLTLLSPKIVEAILNNPTHENGTLKTIMRPFPIKWDQWALLEAWSISRAVRAQFASEHGESCSLKQFNELSGYRP